MKSIATPPTDPDRISGAIVILRGQRVLLDRDLAALYGVETRRLNEQVRRNQQRFPADFIFEVSDEEVATHVAICDIKYGEVLGNDRALTNLLKAIRSLTELPATRKRPIGFTADLDGSE